MLIYINFLFSDPFQSKLSIGQVGTVDLAAPALEIYNDLEYGDDDDDDDSESYKTPPDTPITNIVAR